MRSVGRCILTLQEVSSLQDDPELPGWEVIHKHDDYCAILIPSELSGNIRWTDRTIRTSSVILGELGVIGAYLADSGKNFIEFEHSLVELDAAITKILQAGAKVLAICGDLQVQLEPNIRGCTGPDALGKGTDKESTCHRRALLMRTINKFCLKAANTWLCGRPCYTHKPWQDGTPNKQLDYILVSRSRHCMQNLKSRMPERLGSPIVFRQSAS